MLFSAVIYFILVAAEWIYRMGSCHLGIAETPP